MITDLGTLTRVTGAEAWLTSGDLVTFRFDHKADYREEPTTLPLNVAYQATATGNLCLITEQALPRVEDASIDLIAAALGLPLINLSAPIPVTPVDIPKPWGKEVWYTGIEARGVSLVHDTPIAWLLDVFGYVLYRDESLFAPLLLKILAPLAEENTGDLYFELHTQKVEVYVVTSIDAEAWPDGTGAIRYGFNQALRKQYADDAAFLAAYRQAVSDYEQVRRQLDATTSPDKTLLDEEAQRREAMYAFTSMKDLNVGDVVTVTPMTPHSLQHGVSVIEFQTPHYERFILSFGQQVLTQSHWDTDAALEVAKLDEPATPAPAAISSGVECIADFAEFTALRITLPPGATVPIEVSSYLLVIGVIGEAEAARSEHKKASTVLTEEAIFVPAGDSALQLTNTGSAEAVVLAAYAPPGSSS